MKENHTAALLIFLLTLLLGSASCKKSEVAGNQNSGATSANAAVEEASRTPPFATKEPERYQAVRVTTTTGAGNGAGGANDSASEKTFIARDGERRREDYEAVSGLKISLLLLPGATYVLVPDQKIYAECRAGLDCAPEGKTVSVPADFSPDRLLNEAEPAAHYEKLGIENVNGRTTQKYRVTFRGRTADAKETTTESLIWVDEALGMPVKTELTATDGAKFTEELQEIRETVDPGVFDLPEGYRKVDFAQLKLANSGGK